MVSVTRRKSKAVRGQPWRMPRDIWKLSDEWPLLVTQHMKQWAQVGWEVVVAALAKAPFYPIDKFRLKSLTPLKIVVLMATTSAIAGRFTHSITTAGLINIVPKFQYKVNASFHVHRRFSLLAHKPEKNNFPLRLMLPMPYSTSETRKTCSQ